MKHRFTAAGKTPGISAVYYLLMVTVFAACSTDVPPFDGERAFHFLTAQTDFGPRNPGSDGAKRCLEYLTTELKGTADRVAHQSFTFIDTLQDVSFSLTNIIASFNLTPPGDRRILLMAHWDTRPRADKDPDPEKRSTPILGANDGASGVAVLLHIAEILKENTPPVGVDIALFDGEDYGEESNLAYYCLGAKHFTKNMGSYRPIYGILLDLVGDRDLRLPIEGYSWQYARAVTERIWKKADDLGLNAFVNEFGPTVYDDHLILNQAGIPSVDIIDFNYEYWHTTADTPDKCSSESLAQVGRVVLAMIYE